MSDAIEQQPPLKGKTYQRENWALGMLTLGLLLGPVGLVIGVCLAFTSQRWSLGQKFLTLVIPAALTAILLLGSGAIGSYGCFQAGDEPMICEPHPSPILAWLELAALVGTALWAGIYLYRAARRQSPAY